MLSLWSERHSLARTRTGDFTIKRVVLFLSWVSCLGLPCFVFYSSGILMLLLAIFIDRGDFFAQFRSDLEYDRTFLAIVPLQIIDNNTGILE